MPSKYSKRSKKDKDRGATTEGSSAQSNGLSIRKAYAWRHKTGNTCATYLSRSTDGSKVGVYSMGDIVVSRTTKSGEVQNDILPSYARTNLHNNKDAKHGGPIEIPSDRGQPWQSDSITLTDSPGYGRSQMPDRYTWPKEIRGPMQLWKSQTANSNHSDSKFLYYDGGEMRNLTRTEFIPVTDANYTLINDLPGNGHAEAPARRAEQEVHWAGAHTWYRFSTLDSSGVPQVWTERDIEELRPSEGEVQALVEGLEQVRNSKESIISIPTRSG